MQSLGFLHNFLPFKAVLDLFRPFQEFHLSQLVPDVVTPSLFRSSYWLSHIWLPFMYISYHTGFRFPMDVSKPTQSLEFNIIYYVSVLY